MKHRTSAYWPTRIMLAIGLIATAVIILGTWVQMEPHLGFGPNVFGLPVNVVVAALGVAVPVFGLVWMLAIFRGPRDEPPTWRHRR